MRRPLELFLLVGFLGSCTSSTFGVLLNRWSFNEAAGSATNGTVLVDTISSVPLIVKGVGATYDGTHLTLPGGTSAGEPEATIAAYMDLPNGIISSKTDLTLEFWAAPISGQNWAPLFEFGRWTAAGDGFGADGEWTGMNTGTPPAAQTENNIALILSRNTDLNTQRMGLTINQNRVDLDTNLATTPGQTYHYVFTVQDGVGSFGANGMQAAWYRDGTLVGTRDANYRLQDIDDVNCWLGRLQWTSLGVANIAYDEARIYDHAFDQAEVTASLSAGPDATFGPPVLQPDSTTMHHLQKVMIPVLANDAPGVIPDSVTVIDLPSFGTATPDADGNLLYHHTTGTPSSDSFSYMGSGAGGTSTTATVTIHFSSSLRIPNEAINIPADPPSTTIELVPAYGNLSFNQPITITYAPGDTNRLFVVERRMGLRMIPDVTATNPTSQVFFNVDAYVNTQGEQLGDAIDRGVMSAAFHPGYATNRFFFVWYSVRTAGLDYFRISRFTTSTGDPNAVDPTSERILIQQRDQNGFHLGTDMHFGPDGYLYIATGDGGGQNDSRGNGQVIDRDFFCAILRIDVDKRPGNPEPNAHASVPLDLGIARYSVPIDNPYVTTNAMVSYNGGQLPASSVRTEFFANGLRNPWKFSFDALTGEIWCGDVGQDAREEINIITNGGNYGWAYREGTLNGPRVGQEPASGFNHSPPIYEYDLGNGAFQGFSVSGGLVYRGTAVSSLTGAYIFGDYVSGNIWALRRNGSTVDVQRVAGEAGITAFGTDPATGDLLAVDYGGSRILRVVNGTEDPQSFPQRLSDTGLFADLTDLSPAPGLLPYEPNLAFWSDHAIKRRWFMLPEPLSQMTWAQDDSWTFPDGALWVKHFDLELERGNPNTIQRIETRLLVKNAMGSYGVSYQWNANQTDAVLVPDEGLTTPIQVMVDGSPYMQQYRIPSRAECLACHTPQAGHALSFDTRQLNQTNTIHGFVGNQLELLDNAGYFLNRPAMTNQLPRHLRPDETEFSLEARVRSYLAVNCASCHRAGGTAPESWDARAHLRLEDSGLLDGHAIQDGGNPTNRLIVVGDPLHSIVLNRVAATNGFTRMPQLGSTELDQANIAMLTEWIEQSLPLRQSYDDWRMLHFGSLVSAEGEADEDPDMDRRTNREEWLTGTDPDDGGSFFQAGLAVDGGAAIVDVSLPENRSMLIEQSTNLVEWTRWEVDGNEGFPRPGGLMQFMGPADEPIQYYRFLIWDN